MLYRLKDRRGETLIETLVSLVISALALLMLSGMIASTARLATMGRDWNARLNGFYTFLEEKPVSSGSDNMEVKQGKITITIDRGSEKFIEDKAVRLCIAHYGGKDVISYAVVSGS